MSARLVRIATVLLVATAPAAAQEPVEDAGTLQAFTSDRELLDFLRHVRARAPDAVPCQANASAVVHEATSAAPGRPAVIRGRVSGPGRAPLAAASVWVAGSNLRTATAHDGTYRLVVPPGRAADARPLQVIAS